MDEIPEIPKTVVAPLQSFSIDKNENIPPGIKKDFFSNYWRNGVAIFLLLLSATFTLSYLEKKNQAWANFESLMQKNIVNLIQKHAFKIGVEVPPPAVIILPPPVPHLTGTLPEPEKFTAASVFVKDVKTGEVLYRKNEYEKRPLASISKLMSALVVLESNPDWNSTTTIKGDEDIDDSHVVSGAVYTISDLWEAALVASSNQSMLALADSTGMTREAFVARMNEKALELGMKDSSFVEPTGLSEKNISTASDIAILLEESLRQPKIQRAVVLKEINIAPVGKKKLQHFWSTNWLLLGWVPNKIKDFRGGKTGYITAAGYNFTMQLARDDEKVIDVVILGAKAHELRFSEARDISYDVFSAFAWPSEQVPSTTTSSTLTK
jgi:D-alanyl-D-alanine endopeptidase (penicillin-binding protein 7)